MNLADHDHRANFAETGGTLILYRDYRVLVDIVKAARDAMREIETDLPARCLLCARPDEDHTDGCPVPALRAAFALLDEPRIESGAS